MKWIIILIIVLSFGWIVQRASATSILKGGVAGGSRQTGYGEGPIIIPAEYRPTILRDAIIK